MAESMINGEAAEMWGALHSALEALCIEESRVDNNPNPGPGGIIGQQQQGQAGGIRPGMMAQPNPMNQPGGPPGPTSIMGPPGQPGGQPQRNATQALQQLLQTLKNPSGPHQQSEVLQILKTHPQLMAAFIRHRQIQQQSQQQQGQGGGIRPGMMAQPNPMNQPGGPPGPTSVMGPPGQPGQPVQPGQPGGQPQRNATQALQQLLQTLKNPSGPHQQSEVIQILRTPPQLMAAFIRHRQIQQQQQHQQQQQQQQQ